MKWLMAHMACIEKYCARSIGRPLMGGLRTVESRRSNQLHALPLNMDDEWCVQLFVCSAT
jgi:hypothetical protein